MRQKSLLSPVGQLGLLGSLLLAGCATVAPPPSVQPAVMLVDSLYFTNAMDNRPDVQRTVRALVPGKADIAYFPMAQVKQCDKDGAACAWGVLNAQRTVDQARVSSAGVTLKLDVMVDIDRRQSVNRPDYVMAMAIPSDIPALQSKDSIKQDMVVEFGKPVRIELKYGVAYQLCAMRMDAERQPLDKCNITDY